MWVITRPDFLVNPVQQDGLGNRIQPIVTDPGADQEMVALLHETVILLVIGAIPGKGDPGKAVSPETEKMGVEEFASIIRVNLHNLKRKLKISRKRFVPLIKEELRQVFENAPESWGRYEWRYTTSIGSWTVHTYIDVGSSYSQLWYCHTITPPDRYTRLGEATADKSALVYWAANRISLLAWLGISSQTCWDLLTDLDIPEATKTLALLCLHFMRAVPDLLDGLDY